MMMMMTDQYGWDLAGWCISALQIPSNNIITTFQKSKMADELHFENPIKFLDFKNPKWRMTAFLIIDKTQYQKLFDQIQSDGLPLF